MEINKKYTFIDLFAGCGGLSLGLENAGFFPLFVNELNKDALETYLLNRDLEYPHLRAKYNSRDIKALVSDAGFFDRLFNDLAEDFGRDFDKGKVDLIAGGPPCQGFSGIGLRRSYSVDKVQLPSNHLFQDMAYFVHRVQPKFFLFENVEGLLRSRWTKDGAKGEIFREVMETFRSLDGYSVKFKLVYARDYGVPQNRPRVLAVGKRDDIQGNFLEGDDAVEGGYLPQPTLKYPDIKEIFSDLVDPEFEYGGSTDRYLFEPMNQWQRDIRTVPHTGRVSQKGEVLLEQEYSKHSSAVVERFQHMLANDGQIPDHLKTKKFAQRLLPPKWGNKGPTITACSLPDDFVHYSQARSLTVRECTAANIPRLVSFAGKRTTGGLRRAGNPREAVFEREVPKYTQIGNAVPVKLAEAVGEHFIKILDQQQ